MESRRYRDGKLVWSYSGSTKIHILHLLLANQLIVAAAEYIGCSIWEAQRIYDFAMSLDLNSSLGDL